MAADLRLMSLNLRRDIAADGANRWSNRAARVAELLVRERPHVLATQEALAHQLADLDAMLPGYRRVGVDRAGDGSDEHVAIHYDPSRAILVAWGDLWLSDTPELPASRSWGNRLPRMVTWARFTDQETGRSFTVANTHLDHESPASRKRAAQFLHDRFPDAILVGDFNDIPGGEVHAQLTTTRRDVHDGEATYHGWTGVGRDRIDWVLVPQSMSAAVRTLRERVSDHFPVLAVLSPLS